MEFTLIKKPDLLNWSGNPIAYAIACAPYGAVQAALDIKVQVTVQVEIMRGSGQFIDIRTEVLSPNAEGIVGIDISSLTGPYLKYSFPKLTTLACGRCDDQSRKFRIKWKSVIGSDVGDEETSEACLVCYGGLPYDGAKISDKWHYATNEKFIPLHTSHRLDPEQPAFGSFLYIGDAVIDSPTFDCTLTVYDEDLPATTHAIPFDLIFGDIFYMPIKKLSDQAAPDIVEKIKIGFKNGATLLMESGFEYENRKSYKTNDLLFINSLGGIDCLRVYGEQSISGDYEQSILKLAGSNRINTDMLPAAFSETPALVNKKWHGNTGYILKSDHDLLQSLMLHRLAYMVQDNRLLPVIVIKKSLPGPVSSSFLFDAQLEWQEANDHYYFAQLSTGDYTETSCPALLIFTAVQENSTSLRLGWSCPDPYSKVFVNISNGDPGDDQEVILNGVYGSQIVLISFTGHITITAKLFCGYNTTLAGVVTPNYGPASEIEIDLIANRPPTAVNDSLEITAGYNTPQLLAGNILANDYDADGDDIEILPASGATLQGGWFNITADGKVYYKPPSSAFTGTDQFNYVVREVANPTSNDGGICLINVISGSGSELVYAKLTDNMTGSGQNQVVSVYINTYADVLCTVPKDVTSLGISFNYKKREIVTRMPGNVLVTDIETTENKVGTGTATLIFNGIMVYITPNPGYFPQQLLHVIKFTMLAGTNYIMA